MHSLLSVLPVGDLDICAVMLLIIVYYGNMKLELLAMEKKYQAKNSPPVSPRPSATAERRNTTGSSDENDFRGVESSSSPRVKLSSRSSSGGGGGSRRRFSGKEDQAMSSPKARGALMSSQLSAGGGNGMEGGGKLRPRSSANKLTPRRASEKGSGALEGERSAVPRRYTFNDFDDTDDNTEPGSEVSSRRESRRSVTSVDDDSNFEEDAW